MQENTIKHMRELNKNGPRPKNGNRHKKKVQMEATLGLENLGKRTGTTDTSIINRIQEIEERILGIEDTIEEFNTSVKENINVKSG